MTDIGKHGPVAVVRRPVAKIVVQVLWVCRSPHPWEAENWLDLGGEHPPVPPSGVIERLDPEWVARQDKHASLPVQDGQGEHPDQPGQCADSPGREGVQQDLRIGPRAKSETLVLKCCSQFQVVVDLAVENEGVPPIGRDHRLVPRLGEIQDREPTVDQHRGKLLIGIPRFPRSQV